MEQVEFLADIVLAAVAVGAEFGVPPQVAVAQAALESGWGKFAPHYNYFGLHGAGDAGTSQIEALEYTGDPLTGGYSTKKTPWARFTSPAASLRAWAVRVTSGGFAGSQRWSDDPAGFVTWIWASGYATQPDYPARVVGVMHSAGKLLASGKVPDVPASSAAPWLVGPTPEDKAAWVVLAPYAGAKLATRRTARDAVLGPPQVQQAGLGAVVVLAAGSLAWWWWG